jgi:hypothetical protein
VRTKPNPTPKGAASQPVFFLNFGKYSRKLRLMASGLTNRNMLVYIVSVSFGEIQLHRKIIYLLHVEYFL